MALKYGDMVVLHNDNINNIQYTLGLYIYKSSYIIMLLIIGINPCGWVFWEKSEWYYGYFEELVGYFSDFLLW